MYRYKYIKWKVSNRHTLCGRSLVLLSWNKISMWFWKLSHVLPARTPPMQATQLHFPKRQKRFPTQEPKQNSHSGPRLETYHRLNASNLQGGFGGWFKLKPKWEHVLSHPNELHTFFASTLLFYFCAFTRNTNRLDSSYRNEPLRSIGFRQVFGLTVQYSKICN